MTTSAEFWFSSASFLIDFPFNKETLFPRCRQNTPIDASHHILRSCSNDSKTFNPQFGCLAIIRFRGRAGLVIGFSVQYIQWLEPESGPNSH